MDARMDGWTAGTRRRTLNLHRAPSRTIAYLYYKTAVNSGVHYHKLDRHRVVHVSDGMPRETKQRVLYNKAPGSSQQLSFSGRGYVPAISKVIGPGMDRIDMLLKKIKSSLYLTDVFPATPPFPFGNCFPIGFICSLLLASSRLVKVARLTEYSIMLLAIFRVENIL